MGAFLLEVHSMRGVACREMSRLQDLMEEAAARTPEGGPSLKLQDFKVMGAGRGRVLPSFSSPERCVICVAPYVG